MSNAVAYVRGIIPDAVNREKDDFYPTPPAATRALLGVERFEGAIWECACGDGAMAREFWAAGYVDVISTDLVDRGYGISGVDFLKALRPRAPNIVTNPPFKHAEAFARKALDLTSGKVALLCRLAWLEGAARRKMFETTPLARVWVFSKRVHMFRGGAAGPRGAGGMIAFAWFVWEHGYVGRPTLGWI